MYVRHTKSNEIDLEYYLYIHITQNTRISKKPSQFHLKVTGTGIYYTNPSIGSLFVKIVSISFEIKQKWDLLCKIIQQQCIFEYTWNQLVQTYLGYARVITSNTVQYTLDAYLDRYLTRVPNMKIERFFNNLSHFSVSLEFKNIQ